MNKEQIARLKALAAKTDLTDAESAEFVKLQRLAASKGLDPITGEKTASADDDAEGTEDETPLTPDEVKKLVSEGVTKSLEGLGLDQGVVASLRKSLEGGTSVPTADEIQTAVKAAVGDKVDGKALAKSITDKLAEKSVSADQIKTIVEGLLTENNRRGSKMVFAEDGGTDLLVPAGRAGNVTVAEKQLLNLCLMSAPNEALAQSRGGEGIKRPGSIDEGIETEMLTTARAKGLQILTKAFAGFRGGKAMASSGSDLVNADLSTTLLMRLYMESQLATYMASQELNMPSDPFKLPIITSRVTFYKTAENTAVAAQSVPSTAQATLTSAKLMGEARYSYEADEDAIISILPMLQTSMGQGAAASLENALINGDTTGTHMDSDITTATDAAALFKGLRYYAKSVAGLKVSLATGNITAANIAVMRKVMGKYGMRPADLMIVCGTGGYNQFVQLEETLTVDKIGNSARILTGDAPQIWGIPIIASAYCRENLNASGLYDGTTTNLGSVLLVHKPSWIMGVRRGFTVEVDVDKSLQQNIVIGSFRRAFVPQETPSATIPTVVLGYNFSP